MKLPITVLLLAVTALFGEDYFELNSPPEIVNTNSPEFIKIIPNFLESAGKWHPNAKGMQGYAKAFYTTWKNNK